MIVQLQVGPKQSIKCPVCAAWLGSITKFANTAGKHMGGGAIDSKHHQYKHTCCILVLVTEHISAGVGCSGISPKAGELLQVNVVCQHGTRPTEKTNAPKPFYLFHDTVFVWTPELSYSHRLRIGDF